MFPKKLNSAQWAWVLSLISALLFHYPMFHYVATHIEVWSWNGLLLMVSLVIALLLANQFAYHLVYYLLRKIGQGILILTLLFNALCVYFINTYSVIIDESMMGNVFNTQYSEASSFFSLQGVLFFVLLGILPVYAVARIQVTAVPFKSFVSRSGLTLLTLVLIALVNATNWLWVDKNSKYLGGLAMPWSYSVNTALLLVHQSQKNQKEIPLPKAQITNQQKAVVVLVIGESARRQNFSLYGYAKKTNPLLEGIAGVHPYMAQSSATYTTAGVKSILSYKDSDELYEILPNYLYRNDVDVIWRTTNWGEPPLHIPTVMHGDALGHFCTTENGHYDELLLCGLQQQIQASKKNKILVVLHTSTSHGPTYSQKYPPAFERFTPVCNSVELGQCSTAALVNAYDNTIVYTDYLLAHVIHTLQDLKGYQSALLFVSDHGESLGENNLYMHGLPMSLAPKEQYEIPFIAWASPGSKRLKNKASVTQTHVFHSTMKFLDVRSPIYDENLSIFQ